MTPRLSVAVVLLAALTWTTALSVDADFAPAITLLMGLGMILTATVAIVGILVTGGRWARRLALSGLAMTLVTALMLPLDSLWLVGISLTGIAAASLFSPRLAMRRLPPATAPPTRAVLAPLVLVGAPYLYGLFAGSSPPWALLTLGLSAPVVAFSYAGVKPGGLFALRFGWPAIALGFAPLLDMTTAILSALLGLSILLLAWDRTVKTAFHPPRERGTVFPIPPELSPDEVRDAANIDEKGRPR